MAVLDKERRIDCYPPPCYAKLVNNQAKLQGESKSAIVTEALRQYYDRMPEPERLRIAAGPPTSKNSY